MGTRVFFPKARLLTIALLCLSPPPARSATLLAGNPAASVSVSIPARCAAAVTGVAFGDYTGVLATGTATVTVNCTHTTPYTIGLNAGLAAGATVTTRRLTGTGGAVLAYGLFRDEARTVNWGEALTAVSPPGLGTGTPRTLKVYAAEAAGQKRLPGAYADTVTVTVRY